ncbi:MAG: Spi family protease inhibitor [Muribaculum sp.]|nr:Spi family protease inhibitor [Muribaculum sp.]
MKRTLTIIVASLIIFLQSSAETVSQKAASQLAQEFFNEVHGKIMAPVKLVYNGRNLTTNRLFVPFYIYNLPAGGFVIISAENKTFPILGFSLKENFDPNHIGPKEKALLTSYARDIEMIRYDSRIPYEAIAAWTDIPHYIRSILDAKYEATDPVFTMDDASSRLNGIINTGLAEETASDIYDPKQWQEMINRELNTNQSVAVGLIENGNVYPTIVYGRQGDYFRIELDRRNQWLMRLLPSELLSGLQIADFSFPAAIPLPEPEDTTYRFYDDFAQETRAIEQSRLSDSQATLLDSPIVKAIGGGHYAITLPENVRMLTIYNLGGAISSIRTFKNTNTAFADLSIEPNGFYFANLLGESGKTYGVKLTR